METEAAVLWETHGDWSVEEIELDPPRAGEVLLEMKASGMCHSDEHLRTGDMPFPPPIVGGHEGAGVVVEAGPEVSWLQPGDHVVGGSSPPAAGARPARPATPTSATSAPSSAPAASCRTGRPATTPGARTWPPCACWARSPATPW